MIAKLALYLTPFCPFCVRVRYEMKRLGVSAQICNLYDNPEYSASLMTELGRTTVPVLRIERIDGTVTWMPESADIVRFLQQNHSSA